MEICDRCGNRLQSIDGVCSACSAQVKSKIREIKKHHRMSFASKERWYKRISSGLETDNFLKKIYRIIQGPLAVLKSIWLLPVTIEARKSGARTEAKDTYQIEVNREEKVIDDTLDTLFENEEMSSRLSEFTLQHTRKYDNEQIDYSNYANRLNMFLVYVSRKLDLELESNKEAYTEEILRFWRENVDFALERLSIEKLISRKKTKIYADHMRKTINIDNANNLREVIDEYIDVYGDNCLNELNVLTLSVATDNSYPYVLDLVNRRYTRIKKEYELQRIETQLFNTNSSIKDMKYIDGLTGFEFEDFLEKLFVEFGYTVKELPYSNDYGADLIITKGFSKIVIQAKNYSTNVGNRAVQEVIAAKSHYRCDIGMVITNSYYTPNAVKTAEVSEIILVDRDGLERIISEGSTYFNSLVV